VLNLEFELDKLFSKKTNQLGCTQFAKLEVNLMGKKQESHTYPALDI
jgi:hypothetical protein